MTTRLPSVLSAALRAPLEPRTWRETLHLLLGAAVGAVAAVYLVASAYAVGFSITVAGLALLAVLVRGARVIGVVERARARTLLGLPIAAPPARRGGTAGVINWTRAALTDRVGWRTLGHALVAVPVGLAQGGLVAVLWVEALRALTAPLWSRLTTGVSTTTLLGWLPVESDGPLVPIVGLAGTLAVPWVVRGLAHLDRLRMAALLGPSRLEARAHLLERRRAQAVEQSGMQLRRIERDLHDGAQARIVALAMELGRARNEIARNHDPQRIAAMITSAHEDAKRALVELRDLARGIYPAVLRDLGLDGAVPLLTARCPVPTVADVRVHDRPEPAIETTAYLCIAELVTNVAKHSRAASATVRVRCARRLHVEVRDDGVGGAVPHPGGGLAGLGDRVASVDGHLTITSPDGGPTVVTLELPCAS
jgi:signal transduction histidine kinase